MATRTVVELLCDICEKAEGTTRYVRVDKKAVEVEVCDSCWEKKVQKAVDLLLQRGRRTKRK